MMLTTCCFTFPTKLGWMSLAWRRRIVERLTFGHRSARSAVAALGIKAEEHVRPSREQMELVERLEAFADGVTQDFTDVPLDIASATQFQRRVLHRCRRIPWGQVITYGQLARQCGSPRSARAVGNVMASNRFPIIVPCHRVVGANQSLGGYSAPSGLAMKRRLLRQEGVPIESIS